MDAMRLVRLFHRCPLGTLSKGELHEIRIESVTIGPLRYLTAKIWARDTSGSYKKVKIVAISFQHDLPQLMNLLVRKPGMY
ncbi:hypothetical protein [Gemmobacter serpentinus]|uniref:hypothetical protein n=1 Tax=Gemmobacter serpentinus TaxID=2652247 RepID=UPI00124C2DE6|nr:hypothetical protein [Gemmobacter serpentinus]